MKKTILVAVALFSLTSLQAQFVINSTFQPMTYDEIVAPLRMYQQAYEEALNRLDSYIDKYAEAMNEENYRSAKFYLERCIQLNNRFDGNLIKPKTLQDALAQCEKLIELQDKERAQLGNRKY